MIIFMLTNLSIGVHCCRNITLLPCIEDQALIAGHNHVIKVHDIADNDEGIDDCQTLCYFEEKCASYNFGPSQGLRRPCELINIDHVTLPENLIPYNGAEYCPLENPCSSNPCGAGELCEPEFDRRMFKCLAGHLHCTQLLQHGYNKSGVYIVRPDTRHPFQVYCDQETNGGGWTVIQRRQDGSQDFYLGWQNYKAGFGNLTGEFWLGLDKIFRLTNTTEKKRIRIELEESDFAEYNYFAVDDEANNYTLHLNSYSGTAGDSLRAHRDQPFSTKDRDNDQIHSNCAHKFKGGWWYKKCHTANLNGKYLNGYHSSYADGINWLSWKGYNYSAQEAAMKIRPTNI